MSNPTSSSSGEVPAPISLFDRYDRYMARLDRHLTNPGIIQEIGEIALPIIQGEPTAPENSVVSLTEQSRE